MAVAVVALILTGVLIVSYLTYLVENLPLPWFKVEFLYCGFIAACYVILAILLFVQGGAAYIAGGVRLGLLREKTRLGVSRMVDLSVSWCRWFLIVRRN